MCYCDFGGPEAIWESKPKARKDHICCECLSTIPKGDRYHLVKGVWEGNFDTYKTCEICEQVKNRAMAATSDCICYEQLWETVGVEYE